MPLYFKAVGHGEDVLWRGLNNRHVVFAKALSKALHEALSDSDGPKHCPATGKYYELLSFAVAVPYSLIQNQLEKTWGRQQHQEESGKPSIA
jgi:hypothetical protein